MYGPDGLHDIPPSIHPLWYLTLTI